LVFLCLALMTNISLAQTKQEKQPAKQKRVVESAEQQKEKKEAKEKELRKEKKEKYKDADKDKYENEEMQEEEDEYDGPGKAMAFEVERTKDPATGKVPWDQLRIAIEKTDQAKKSAAANLTTALTWSERGPNGDIRGPFGNSRPTGQQTSGRIRTIMVDSLDATHKTVWAGSVSGGLWKTTDITVSPANWVLVNDYLSNLAISDICQDPRSGHQTTMYFCTGESYFNIDAVNGVGVFKSTDGGATWNFLASTSSYTSCTKIVCDAQGNVYLGTVGNGLLRSIDGGTTWTNITPSGLNNRIADIEISSTGRLHITTGVFSTNAYRYTDIPATVTSGSGWNSATTPFTTFDNRTEIVVSGNILYALPVKYINPFYIVETIWKSSDGGDNWSATSGQPTSGWSGNQCWYNLSAAINPANVNECIVGALDCYKTTNGGASWTKISSWATTSTGFYIHADQHDIQWWDGGNKLLFACDGGVHYSSDGGANMDDRNKGLRIKQFYSVAIHPTETNTFLAGAQDNGMHRMNHVGLDSSLEVVGGDGAYCAIDQDEPQYEFGSYVYNVYRRSTNNGASWTTPVNNQSGGRFINPWDYDNSANIIYACYSSGTYLRWNNPQTGSSTDVVTATGFTGNVSAVHVSPYTANRVYFGMGTGGIQYVDNANTGTSVVATDITPSGAAGYVNCIVTGSSDQNLIACYSSYNVTNVWLSTNGGTSWTACDGNLPNMPVRWALFNPDDNTKAYIATETGVWETDLLNGGSTVWTANSTFPNVRTDMMEYRASDRTIAVGTHGRGIWTTTIPSLAGPTVTIDQAAAQADPTSASPINFTVVFSESVSDFTTGDVTLSGTAGATTATVTGSGTTYNVAVTGMTSSGTVIATIAGGVATGDGSAAPNDPSTSTDNSVTYNQPAVGDLIVTEIMQNPFKVGDTEGEWFEVYNTTGTAIDMNGWVIKDLGSDSHTISSSLIVPANGFAVLGINSNSGTNGGLTVNYQYSGFALANGDDEVILQNGTAGIIIDEVDYDGGPVFPDPNGKSMTLNPTKFNSVDNDNGANWCEATTPYG
ncbi:MAG: lamin tail domain-containing protein, partial [Chitinophagaceae bacterium]|nr:lamin tail domain-containing protein [Chitinophagaceae bacterium]